MWQIIGQVGTTLVLLLVIQSCEKRDRMNQQDKNVLKSFTFSRIPLTTLQTSSLTWSLNAVKFQGTCFPTFFCYPRLVELSSSFGRTSWIDTRYSHSQWKTLVDDAAQFGRFITSMELLYSKIYAQNSESMISIDFQLSFAVTNYTTLHHKTFYGAFKYSIRLSL